MLMKVKLPWQSFAKAMSDRTLRLAAAVDMLARYGGTDQRAAKNAGVPLTDIKYLRKLFAESQVALEKVAVQIDDSIRSVVDMYFEQLTVHLDTRAVEDLLLVAAETRLVPLGRKSPFTEAYGCCYGNRKTQRLPGRPESVTTVRVDRFTTQMRAVATSNSIEPNRQSHLVHHKVGELFFNHLELIGDWHTHPYHSLKRLKKVQGWKYSKDDSEQIEGWWDDVRREGHSPRFSLVVAVAEGGKIGRSSLRQASNRIRLTVGSLYVFIAAYRIDPNGGYDTDIHKVRLTCPQAPDA